MKGMRIGEVAERSGVGIETIRYYEREGLLVEPDRKPSGYRKYDKSVVARLQFIRRTKELGFTLAEIKAMLGLWSATNTKCVHIRQRAENKVADIDEKIRLLQKMKRSLRKLMKQCESGNSIEKCPLLEGLDGEAGRSR